MKGEPPQTGVAASSAQTAESSENLGEAQVTSGGTPSDGETPSATSAYPFDVLCRDWKTYEELSLSIFKLKEGLASKQDLVSQLRQRFVRYADLLADCNVEEYPLRPQQRLLAASRHQGDTIQSRLKEAISQGTLPHPGDPFGQFSCNSHFLSVRQLTTKEQLATEEGISQFQIAFNAMSADKWGNLVALHPTDFVNIELSEDQVAAAEHFRAHREVQRKALQEIEASMFKIDPFWKYRSFAYGPAFLHAKLLCHFNADQFQVWVDGQAAQDPELHNLLQLHKLRFLRDALSPSEQAQVWPRMIDFSEREDLSKLSSKVDQGEALEPSSTRIVVESDGGKANAQAVANAKALQQKFAEKLAVGVLQESLGDLVKLIFDVFCAGLERTQPGSTPWCLENKFLILTRSLNGKGDQQRLTSAVQFLHMNNFAAAKKELVEWQKSCHLTEAEPEDVFSSWRQDVSFVLAKFSLESMLAQQCQQLASQLIAIDEAVVNELAAIDPVNSFLELAALAACGLHDPATAKKGHDHILKQAQAQMAAAGQTASKAQVEEMIIQSKARQLETNREALMQQAAQIESLARAYEASAAVAAAVAGPEGPTAARAATTESHSTAEESQQNNQRQSGPNVFNMFANNGNFLVAVLMARLIIEAITEPIHAYLNRIDPDAAKFLLEHRLQIACISPASEAIEGLKQLANEKPSSETPALVLKISQGLLDASVSAEKEFALVDESTAAVLGKHMRDPVFVLLHDSLVQIGAQMHAQAHSMLSQGAPQDPSGTLEQIATLLNSAQGKNDFITFPLSAEERAAARGILEQQGAFAQVLAQADLSKKGTREYVESVTKDIAPFYSTLAASGGKADRRKAVEPTDVFEPVRAGAFFAANVADEAILGAYSQFMVFRRTARADPTVLPKVVSACKANAPFNTIGKLISSNTEAFVSGHWFPEEMNFAYVKATETKIMTWHEEEVAVSGASPFRSWATEVTFLLAKRAIFERPAPETFGEMQQQLVSWGRPDIAEGIGKYANELLQINGGRLSPIELARLDFMDETKEATNSLRRRVMGLSGGSDESRAFDDLRTSAASAGSGVSGIETLMVLASIVDGGSSTGPQASAIQARFARRDPASADLVVQFGNAMFERGEQLLRHEENRLKYGATAGLLRACMPPAEQGQYGTLVSTSSASLPTSTCVIPPLDVEVFPPAVRKRCRAQIQHLQSALQFCISRDQSLKDIPKSRKKSVFEAHYLGGHTGASTQFLLWKLEFIALKTADDCQQVINGEQKALGQLIFANTAAFRAEPFFSDELNSLKELLRKAETALGTEDSNQNYHDVGDGASPASLQMKHAGSSKSQSVFAECWNDPSFCHEVVVAQQLCDQDGSDSDESPKSKMMKRFRLKPELAKYRALVEAHFEAFIREPLPVAAQMKGWQQYLQLKFQADYAAASIDDKPELAQAIASKDVQRVLHVLDHNRHLPRDVLFATYGPVANQSVLLDALRVGPFKLVEAVLHHGYPVATQRVGNSESGASWPLLHYLLIAWAEHLRNANHDISALQQRFSDVLPLLAENGADFRAVANGFTPLYIAGTSSVEMAVQGILSVLEQRGLPCSDEINRAVGDESAPTSVFQAVANGSDPSTLRLLHARGGDLEAPRVTLNSQKDMVQSIPPLHLALAQTTQTQDLAMVEALLKLGASANSCALGPWLQSELIKKLGRMHAVGSDLADELSLTLMRTSCLMASATLSPSVVELLLAHGASPTFVDPTSGFTALHQVVREKVIRLELH
jgi:hypothetical protein